MSMFKKIASNTLAQLTAKFFGAGLTLLTTYYIIRLAGIDLYGDLTKILVLVAVGFTAIDFGLNADAVRVGITDEKLQASTSRAFTSRLFLSFFFVFVLNLLIQILPGGYSSEVKSIFWLGSLAIIFQGIYTSGNAWFQGKLSYWRSTISVVAGSLIGAALTFYYLHSSPSLMNLVLANTLGYFSMAITSLLLLPRPLLKFNDFNFKVISSTLTNSLVLGLILIASVIASKIDTVLLGIFKSSGEVGEYGFAYRIFDVLLVLPVFVMNALYPLMIQFKEGSAKLLKQSLLILGVLGIFTAVITWFAAPLIYYLKPGLDISISSLRLLSFSLPLFYVTAPLMWHLITKRKDKLVLFTYLLAAVFNGIINYLLIPRFGASGSAITTGLTELLIFVFLLYFSL